MKPWHRVGMLLLVIAALLSLIWLVERSQATAGPSLERTAAGMELEAVLVRVDPPDQTIPLGEQFTITVQIAGLEEPLSAFQFDLGYDPALIKPAGTTRGAFLSSTGRMVICPEPAHPDASTIRLACAGAGEAPGPTGSGLLATLAFTTQGVGTSPLTLSALELPGDGVPPVPIAATAQDGQVTVVPVPAVALGGGGTIIGAPGVVVTHVFTLTNLGNYTDTFALDVTGNTWPTAPVSDTIGPVGARQSVSVPVMVDIPLLAGETIIGSDSFTLTATSNWDGDATDSAQGTTLASVEPGVTLGDDQARIGLPGLVVTYVFTVTNLGNYTDTFTLEVAGNEWPTAPVTDTAGPLAAGQAVSVPVGVTIPPSVKGVIVASDSFTLTATSGWDEGVADSARGTTSANVEPGVGLSDDQTVVGAPGTLVTHTFTVTNVGDYTDTFTLDVTGYEWPTTPVTGTAGPLGAGQSAPVEVSVAIPFPARGVIVGSDSFTLTATSGWDDGVADSAQGTTLADVEPGVALGDDQAGVGEVLSQIVYTLTVVNTGDYSDTIALSVSGSGWEAALSSPTSGPLATGDVFSFTLTLSIPDVLSGTWDVATVQAVSGLDPGVTDTARLTTTAIVPLPEGHWIYLPVIVKDSGGR